MTYASIELLSAMNEFIYYGRAKALWIILIKGLLSARKLMKSMMKIFLRE